MPTRFLQHNSSALATDEANKVLFRGSDSTQTFTFTMETLLLVQDDELAVLMGLLQDVLALLDVAVVVFQAEEGGHQRHIGLKGIRRCQQRHTFPQLLPVTKVSLPAQMDSEVQLFYTIKSRSV